MRKLILMLLVAGGTLVAGHVPASANAATGLAVTPGVTTSAAAEKVTWRHHRHHHGFNFGIGFGSPYYYGYYPRYRYYNDYGYGYYPRYRYYGGWRGHHRNHWRHRRW